MKAILLDGSRINDSTGKRVHAALATQLQNQGWDVERITLCEQKIGSCAGDFFCWIRTPGVCNVNDDNRRIAETLMNSDLLVYLTPVTFGGYSSTLKYMVDHQIQNISPFFTTVENETHHQKRYKKHPDLLAVGWMDAPDQQSETVFRLLVQCNAINFHARHSASGVVFANQTDAEMLASARQWLSELQTGQSTRWEGRPVNSSTAAVPGNDITNGPEKICRALLLVGSPKTRKSTSNSLGGYLFEKFTAQSIQTETIYLHTVLRSPAKLQALLDAVDRADLVTLSFPLYVDSLPAPVTEALERIAAHRQDRSPSRQQLFTAIVNCGFPEAKHCDTALAICEIFAQQARFTWAGGLALGGGGMVNGTSLVDGGGKTILMRKSLELAADALAQGQPVPQDAQDTLRKPLLPHWAYRLMGNLGWLIQAKHYGALKRIGWKPYLAKTR